MDCPRPWIHPASMFTHGSTPTFPRQGSAKAEGATELDTLACFQGNPIQCVLRG